MKIAVLLTCHNRKKKTLTCLERLYQQTIPSTFLFDTYLVDDGCTDGTSEAVKEFYPNVIIIKGDGSLFWNRGMHMAWSEAISSKVEYDGVLWLNDDTILYECAMLELSRYLVLDSPHIIVGTTCSSSDNSIVTYGGFYKDKRLSPSTQPQTCDNFNGNFVYVPQEVYNKIGILDYFYRHSAGDYDYALRAYKAGYKCIILPVIGVCDRNSPIAIWMKGNLLQRYKALYSPLGNSPIESFHYNKQKSFPRAIFYFVYIHLRVLFTFF